MNRKIARIGTVAAAVLVLSTPALATHNAPFKANKFHIAFVRAYTKCTSPTLSHNGPATPFAACPPASASPVVSFGPLGHGELDGHVLLDAAKQASDLRMTVKFADVRNGDDGTGSPFDGLLTLAILGRSTDHDCGGAVHTPCTMIDSPLPVSVPCGSAASPPLPSGKCVRKTTWNQLAPGLVQGGNRANIGLAQVQVYQGTDLIFEGGVELP